MREKHNVLIDIGIVIVIIYLIIELKGFMGAEEFKLLLMRYILFGLIITIMIRFLEGRTRWF